jgi:hypothetical protein
VSCAPYEGPIISRAEAKARGLKRYFNGPDKPCVHGHVAERRVCNKACLKCNAEYWKKNPDRAMAYVAARYEADRDKDRARHAAHYKANRDEVMARSAAYRAANKDKVLAQQVAYRAAKKAATTNQ